MENQEFKYHTTEYLFILTEQLSLNLCKNASSFKLKAKLALELFLSICCGVQ